ncbi:MAG: cytochrome P450 [Candidatus Limnocylindrales bacterium]|nr:cytochrome P450 [Candidatus Limnocylindrales bacterium]
MTHSAVDPRAVAPVAIGFEPADPAFVADPYPVYRRLRDDHPVLWNPATNQWLISRHADVNRLLRDRRLGRTYLHQATHAEMARPEPPAWHAPFHELNDAGMLDMEPPDHTRLRRLVLRAFTPRTVEAMRRRIQGIVDGLIDGFDGAGEVDLIADFVEPLPVTVIAELLDVPEADRHLLRPWSADFCLMYELDPPDASARKAVQASLEFGAYLRELLAERRRRPGDDLISALAGVVDGGDTLTETELIGTCVLLLNAGHEASVNGAGNAWWTLFRHPEALARLRADPSLLSSALEELLRFDTPLSLFERWVLEPIEVEGVAIPRGGEVALLFGSANRDQAAFERPDELDLARDPNAYLSFGAGIHYCLGAPLARLEIEVAFGTLLRRIPRLELVEPPRWKPTFVLRGLQALRVRV